MTSAASSDRVGWRATAAAHLEELAGDTGTSTGLVKLETVQGTRTSQRVMGEVSNGTITLAKVGAETQEIMRFSLTQKGDGPQFPIY